jgi:hypothetical protein
MNHVPNMGELRIAALANLALWSQVSESVSGSRAPGFVLAAGAMVAAQQAGCIDNLPKALQLPVRVLTLPGSIAVAESQACCEPCAADRGGNGKA